MAARLALESGNADMQTIEEEAQQALEGAGFRRDYFTICRQQDLQPATKEDKQLAIVAAAYLGGARLIDNIRFTLP